MKKNCRAKHGGAFSAELNINTLTMKGSENVLILKAKHKVERIVVPEYMVPEAKQVMKATGEKVLRFAELCITHEVALKAWPKLRKTKRARKTTQLMVAAE